MATKVESNQLTDYWEDAATQTLPDYSGQTSTGFAQDGNPVTGQKATLPGAAWFNIMAAVRVSVILAAGKTPSNPPDPLQFLEALQSLGWMTSKSVKTDVLADKSVTNAKLADQAVTIAKIANALLATQSQAEAGTATDVLMTPLRVKQAIEKVLEEDLPKASATQLGGVKITGNDGITINGSGEIAVDFSQMPTDKFEDLVKSIRVPIWLESGKNFYVNGSTGSDTEDEGRGESASKPFKTIQKCINYIADNYNLSSYTSYVNITDGTYEEDIRLPLYNSTTGSIQISGNSENKNAVIVRRIYSQSAVTYNIRNLTVQRTEAFSNFGGVVLISAGRVNFLNVEIDTTLIPETSAGFAGLVCSSNAFCNISGSSSISNPGIFIRTNATTKCVNGIQATSGGRINFNGNLNLIGDAPESFVCAAADNLSSIRFVSSGLPYPVGTPTVINEGNKLGKRYNIRTNAIIDTSGQGPELFPGTIAGTTGSGGQYV